MGMMKAGRMDRQITIQRASYVVSPAGTANPTWADLATVWAQVIQRSTKEFIAASGGAQDTDTVVFRIRYLDGVTAADRVFFDGGAFDITEIAPVRREGLLDLRCVS